MSTITWPTGLRPPRATQFGIKANTQVMVSPLNGSVQTLELPGPRWVLEADFPPLFAAEAGVMRSYVMRLRGQANRAALYDFANPAPKGTIAGASPLVNGAVVAGLATLAADAAGASKTLLRGDMFAVNGELKMCVADATSDGAGNISVTFEPPLRAALADNAAITLDKPTALFVLQDAQTMWRAGIDKNTDFSLAFVEVFQ